MVIRLSRIVFECAKSFEVLVLAFTSCKRRHKREVMGSDQEPGSGQGRVEPCLGNLEFCLRIVCVESQLWSPDLI